ncbi:MAG: aspartate/tyrosine/aromatic aminotransferase [Parachlamydiaceae bacterium]|nr:aspartate/tyrosine/aromatic aminotransferase [Parachlamydiaceae bacterium]
MTYFEKITLLPNDPIFSLNTLFAADTNPNKVNLGVGVYMDEFGKLKVLEAVRESEKQILQAKLDKNYPPLDGLPDYIQKALKIIFGEEQGPTYLYGAQAIGGTGALRLGAEFLAINVGGPIYIPQPTWANHSKIFTNAGLKVQEYPYYDAETHSLKFPEICQSIEAMPKGSSMVLHACCHNPSGMDFSDGQWLEISRLLKKHEIIPFFDFAYQGFGIDFETDAKAVRLFRREGHEMLVSYSFSKNMGLYGERIGLLAVTAQAEQSLINIASQVKQIIRGSYSMAPLQGARIVAMILGSETLRSQWQEELSVMQQRVSVMREALMSGLVAVSKNLDFSFLSNQKGMFSFSGLTPQQVLALRQQYSIFMTNDGRINVAGLNSNNIDYVSNAIAAILNSTI